MKECNKNYSTYAECDEDPCESTPPVLKPCPFCGSEAINAICCESAECPVKPYVVGKSMQEAVKRWNTRKSME